jgi:pimeloyl-ACP methyl ester carboxylesterase
MSASTPAPAPGASCDPWPASSLPEGVRSRRVTEVNGLSVHLLEAGFESPGRPCVLLLHGFPELAYSWRKVMPELAALGCHVVAPDQRGYGRTTGWDAAYDGDLRPFRILNLVQDALALVWALGHRSVAAVVGHDFGSPVAAWCALVRPDVFRSVVLMSAPFAGPPELPFDTCCHAPAPGRQDSIDDALAALERPRKHYQGYYGTRQANDDLWRCPQGVHDFLRAYYHHKSADWTLNRPTPLESSSADALAQMPTYYIMDRSLTMAQTVAPEMPSADAIAACRWLPDAELRHYSEEYRRTGFQGGLQWYRAAAHPGLSAELALFGGRRIEVPSMFIAGRSDWGVYQKPGDFERMQRAACTDMRDCHLLDGAGHWVQQEQGAAVAALLVSFLEQTATRT